MTFLRSLLICMCLVAASLAIVAHAAVADGFTASYSLGSPAAAGADVQITISLAVTNNSSSNVSNASIALHDPRAARVTYGSLNGLALPAGAATQVSGSFKVPRQLYESWQRGSSPAMSVSFTDANRKPVQMFIEF
ncbi:MAG TPA: hypothetical protein VKL99_03220 [Candidatus Angelobacter sp.]|nr:hypothetical protein [Candidatus Angelobacter sp.]